MNRFYGNPLAAMYQRFLAPRNNASDYGGASYSSFMPQEYNLARMAQITRQAQNESDNSATNFRNDPSSHNAWAQGITDSNLKRDQYLSNPELSSQLRLGNGAYGPNGIMTLGGRGTAGSGAGMGGGGGGGAHVMSDAGLPAAASGYDLVGGSMLAHDRPTAFTQGSELAAQQGGGGGWRPNIQEYGADKSAQAPVDTSPRGTGGGGEGGMYQMLRNENSGSTDVRGDARIDRTQRPFDLSTLDGYGNDPGSGGMPSMAAGPHDDFLRNTGMSAGDYGKLYPEGIQSGNGALPPGYTPEGNRSAAGLGPTPYNSPADAWANQPSVVKDGNIITSQDAYNQAKAQRAAMEASAERGGDADLDNYNSVGSPGPNFARQMDPYVSSAQGLPAAGLGMDRSNPFNSDMYSGVPQRSYDAQPFNISDGFQAGQTLGSWGADAMGGYQQGDYGGLFD